MRSCLNCQTPLAGPYCAECGQRDIDLERPLSTLLAEFLRETLQVDGRAARSLRVLLSRPGVLTQDYLAGRRQQYSSPLRLYLVISVLFFLVAAWVADRGILLGDGEALAAEASRQAQFFSDELPQLMFLLLPVFAALLKLAYRRRHYLHHLIHSLHLHSAAYLLLVLLLPLERAAGRNALLLMLQVVLLLYLIYYLLVSLRRVYGGGWMATSAKASLVFLLYFSLTAVVLQGLSRIAAKVPIGGGSLVG